MPLRALNLLLVEPQSLIRSTVVAVSRELRLPRIDEASTINAAVVRLQRASYDGVLLSLDEHEAALTLLQRLRAGQYLSAPDVPVAVMASSCNAETAALMKQHEVGRVLLKPFKVKTLLETIGAMGEQVLQRETA